MHAKYDTSFGNKVLPMRKRCEIINENVKSITCLDTILPAIMQEAGFDMWLVICLEDNLDPVFTTMIPPHWIPGAHRSCKCWCFSKNQTAPLNGFLKFSRTRMHELYEMPYTVQMPEFQWGWLREVIECQGSKTNCDQSGGSRLGR